MNNITNKMQGTSSGSTENNRSDGMWAFFILTYVLMLLTWGVLAIFQLPVANSANPNAPTSALAMALYFLGGFTPLYRRHIHGLPSAGSCRTA